MDSLVAKHVAMYSASHVEVETQVCFFDFQLTAPPAIKKTKPLVDLRLFRQPAQSASENPSATNGLLPLNNIP